MVSGIFRLPTGWPENIAFVSLSTARRLLRQRRCGLIRRHKAGGCLFGGWRCRKSAGYGYKAESWQTLYPEILKTLAIEQFQNRLIMLLIMIIAAFGIGSVMYMLVNEKTSEIGMFMAMGASGKNIRNIFLMESGVLGLMGGVLGGVRPSRCPLSAKP